MNVRKLLAAAAVVASFFLAAQPAAGQRVAPDTMLISTALWTGCPGLTVRVRVAPADTVTGRCGPVADGRLVMQTEQGSREIELTEVRSLEVRKSRMAETALLLSLAGLVVGHTFGLPEEQLVCVPACPEEGSSAARGRGAAVGAVVGAAVGLLVGSRLKYWDWRYP